MSSIRSAQGILRGGVGLWSLMASFSSKSACGAAGMTMGSGGNLRATLAARVRMM
jgi:hypothetical protein